MRNRGSRPHRLNPNRREFLKMLGLGATATAFLGACQPVASPAAAPTPATAGAISGMERSPWVTGNIPADISVPFRYTAWEGEEEMRKWILHFDNFFSENYPNVSVQGDWGVPWGEYWTKMPTQLAAGAPIELMWMHDSRCQTFASNGWLLPLDDFLASYTPPGWPDEFYESQVRSFQYQGRQYGIPYDFASGGFYLNLDLFEEAGVEPPNADTTWDEFLEIAQALTKEENGRTVQWGVGGIPTTWSGGIYFIIKSFGGDFWNEDVTESRFNQPETIDAFQFVSDLMWEHGVMPSADMLAGLGMGSSLAFSSGLTAMTYTLNDEAFVLHETIEGKFNWGFAPTPQGPAGQYYFVGGSAFSIPHTSTQPEMAYELMRYTLTNPETLPISGQMGSQFTGNVNYYEYGLPPADWGVDVEAFRETFYTLPRQHGTHPNYHPKYLEWDTSIYRATIDPLWIGEERDAAVACMACHELTNRLLSS
jgi:multiple sugar transport system substrate-binding protein